MEGDMSRSSEMPSFCGTINMIPVTVVEQPANKIMYTQLYLFIDY